MMCNEFNKLNLKELVMADTCPAKVFWYFHPWKKTIHHKYTPPVKSSQEVGREGEEAILNLNMPPLKGRVEQDDD